MVCNWGVGAGANVGAGVGVGDGEERDCGVPWDCARKDPVEAKAVIDNTVTRKIIRPEIIRPASKRLICLGLALKVSFRGICIAKNATSQVGTATTCGTSFGFSPRRGEPGRDITAYRIAARLSELCGILGDEVIRAAWFAGTWMTSMPSLI